MKFRTVGWAAAISLAGAPAVAGTITQSDNVILINIVNEFPLTIVPQPI